VSPVVRFGGVVLVAFVCGCSPGDVANLASDPRPAHIAFYLLLAPVFLLLRQFIGQLVWNLLPAWMKTRRALWTGIVLLALATAGGVAYWGNAGPR
jgi:hypothetical protein